MIFYILLPIISFAVGFPFVFIKKKRLAKLLCSLVCSIILFVFSAFKDTSIGIDTAAYITAFTTLKGGSFTFHYAGFEPIFVVYLWVIGKSGLPFLAVEVISYAFVYGVMAFLIYRESDNVNVSFFFLYISSFFLFALSGLRQSIATSFVFLFAWVFLKKKGVWKVASFLLFLIALGFHRSAIVFLPFVLIGRAKMKRWFYVAATLLLIIYLVSPDIYYLASLFLNVRYVPAKAGRNLTFFVYLLFFFIFAFCSFFEIVLENKRVSLRPLVVDKKTNLYLWAYYFVVFFQGGTNASGSFGRFSLYFQPVLCLLFPRFFQARAPKINKLIMMVCLGGYYLVFVYQTLHNGVGVSNYQFLDFRNAFR